VIFGAQRQCKSLKTFLSWASETSASQTCRLRDSLPRTTAASAGRHTDAVGEHNLALVLSNLHFPWCLGEVNVSSCFLLLEDLSYVCALGVTPIYFWLGKRKCVFFLAFSSADLESMWESETLQLLWGCCLDVLPPRLHTLFVSAYILGLVWLHLDKCSTFLTRSLTCAEYFARRRPASQPLSQTLSCRACSSSRFRRIRDSLASFIFFSLSARRRSISFLRFRFASVASRSFSFLATRKNSNSWEEGIVEVSTEDGNLSIWGLNDNDSYLIINYQLIMDRQAENIKHLFLTVAGLKASCFLVHSSHSREHNISVTPWGNFFKFGTGVHFNWRMNWLKFGGQRLKDKVMVIFLAITHTLIMKQFNSNVYKDKMKFCKNTSGHYSIL